MSTPAVNHMVHYVSYGTPGGEYLPKCRSATITEVGAWLPVPGQPPPPAEPLPGDRRTVTMEWVPDACALVIQNPGGTFYNTCRHHEGDIGHDHSGNPIPARSYPGGTWHWPEPLDEPTPSVGAALLAELRASDQGPAPVEAAG